MGVIDYVTPVPAPPESPCTGVCALDTTRDWCLGCGRSIDEIAGWSLMTPVERDATVARLPGRLMILALPS